MNAESFGWALCAIALVILVYGLLGCGSNWLRLRRQIKADEFRRRVLAPGVTIHQPRPWPSACNPSRTPPPAPPCRIVREGYRPPLPPEPESFAPFSYFTPSRHDTNCDERPAPSYSGYGGTSDGGGASGDWSSSSSGSDSSSSSSSSSSD